MEYKISLVLTPQPEGGYVVTCPSLPELITEGDTVQEALNNVPDALAAVVETYQDLGRQLPADARIIDVRVPLSFDTVITAP